MEFLESADPYQFLSTYNKVGIKVMLTSLVYH